MNWFLSLFLLIPVAAFGQVSGGAKGLLPRVVSTNSLASGGIQFVSFSTNRTSASTALVVTMPAGIASGNLITLFIVTDNDSFLNSLDTGWVVRETNSLASAGFWVVQKISDGTEGATETFGFAAVETASTVCVVHRNTHATAPFDGDAIGTGVGPLHISPSVLPSQNNSLLLGCFFIDPASAVNYTQVTGYTILGTCDSAANGSLAVVEKVQTTATSEGTQIEENLEITFGEYTMANLPL